MSIDSKLKVFRKVCRNGSRAVMDHVIKNFLSRSEGKAIIVGEPEICVFCGSTENITKEHVLPKWTFEGATERFFITNMNGVSQTYNKTTVPACNICNNDLLSDLEKYITNLLVNTDTKNLNLSTSEKANVIRWLETIDYKFQILNIRRKFLRFASGSYIPYLADFPLSLLRLDNVHTDHSVIAEIRRSRKRLIVKNKNQSINSLVIIRTRNKSFYFFHEMDDFIFLELPQYGLALFYFYNKIFETAQAAQNEARILVEKHY
ncbi:hypothetical protein GCM10028808_00620 [Spirosoma migulaei]